MSASPNANASASSSNPDPNSRPEIPWAFHDCSTETLIILISHMLNLLIQHNDQVILTPDSLTRFHSKSAPDIKVLDYLTRIVKYTNMEKIPLLSLLAYIDVTCTNLPTFTLSSLTVHRFLIAGVCAGSKAQCDVFCTNSHYAKVGGIQIKELNALEMEFLKVTRWDLCCKAELLQRYYTSLIKSHGGFTQAPEPADNPFAKLPQPTAGPSVESGAEPVPEAAHPASAETEQDTAGPSSSTRNTGGAEASFVPRKRGTRRDSRLETRRSAESGETSGRQNPTEPVPVPGAGTSGMDVDEDEFPSPNDQASSPASSSVPSSSRSSLRTRNVSSSQLAPSFGGTAASPRVDMTTASGRVIMDIDAEEDGQRVTSNDSGNGDQDTSRHAHQQSTGGKLLKSLVGGIFKRRDSAHHSDPPQPPPPPPPQPSQTTSNGNAHRLIPPHQSPGRRVKSPLMTTMPQGDPPAMAAPVTPRVRSREETNGF